MGLKISLEGGDLLRLLDGGEERRERREIRRQRTDGGGQRSEVRGQRSEVRGQKQLVTCNV